jgi:hypothetical protein
MYFFFFENRWPLDRSLERQLAVVGCVLTVTRVARTGRMLAAAGIGLLAIVGFSPLGNVLILPVEERFPPWSAAQASPA